jgi:hypothetical protein
LFMIYDHVLEIKIRVGPYIDASLCHKSNARHTRSAGPYSHRDIALIAITPGQRRGIAAGPCLAHKKKPASRAG